MFPSSKVILDSGFVTIWVSTDGGAQMLIILSPTFALAKRPSLPRNVTRYWGLGDYKQAKSCHYNDSNLALVLCIPEDDLFLWHKVFLWDQPLVLDGLTAPLMTLLQ